MHALANALQHRDFEAIMHSMADNAVYRSPVMAQPLTGAGIAEIMAVFCEVVTAIDDLEEFTAADTLVLVGRVTAGSITGQAAWVVRLNDRGEASELSWHVRPFSMVVHLANSFAAGLARNRGGIMPTLVRVGRPVNRLVAHTVDLLAPVVAPAAQPSFSKPTTPSGPQ